MDVAPFSYVVVVACLAAGGCSFSPPMASSDDLEPDAASPDSGADGLRKAIVIAPPPLPGGIDDIPIAIIFGEDADLASAARTDGLDIVFSDADGSLRLAHEIESYDPATGALVAWVKIPNLAAGENTIIHMHYGVSDERASSDASATWSNGFRGVWHLASRDFGGITREYRDSTSNGNHGRATGISRPASVDGLVGPAVEFSGSGQQEIFIGDPLDNSLDPGLESFSYSVWVRVQESQGLKDLPFYNGGFDDSSGQSGYDFELGTITWRASLADGQRDVDVSYGEEEAFLGGWVHLVAVIDRQTSPPQLRGYVNGTLADTADISSLGAIEPTIGARIGDKTNPFRGLVDEVRVLSLALDAERILLEHMNLRDPRALYTVGEEEGAPYPAPRL